MAINDPRCLDAYSRRVCVEPLVIPPVYLTTFKKLAISESLNLTSSAFSFPMSEWTLPF